MSFLARLWLQLPDFRQFLHFFRHRHAVLSRITGLGVGSLREELGMSAFEVLLEHGVRLEGAPAALDRTLIHSKF